MPRATLYCYNIDGSYNSEYKSMREAERSLGLYRGAVVDLMKRKSPGGKYVFSFVKLDKSLMVLPSQEETEQPGQLLTETDLRQRHDLFFMILSYLQKICEGKFIEEGAMLRTLGLVGKPRHRDALSRPELKDYKGRVDGVTYYGSVESIKKLKREGVLQ